MNKKLVYIIIVVVLGCFKSKAQDTLIPLSKLKNETLYIFDYGVLKNVENDSYFSTLLENEITVDVLTEYAHKYPQMVDTNPVLFANIKSNSFKISHNRKIINKYDLDTIDKNKVYRLMLIGTYPDSIEFSKLNFPNLQELHMYRNGTFPKDISIYINLQILDVDQLYGEIFVDYSAPLQIAILDTMGYKIPSVFPEEIYRLPHLKVLYFDVEKGTYVTLSEKVNELKQLDASYVHDYYNQLYIPVSLLQYHNFNVKQILGFGETANGYWKRNPRKKIEEVEVFNTRSTKYKTHRMLFGTCKYIQKYNNGNLMIQGRFEKRKPVGKWTMWYENGHICQERFYKDGVEDSVWTFWNRKDSSKTKYNSYNNDTIRYQIYFTKGYIDSLIYFNYYNNILCKEQVISNFSDYYNRTEITYGNNIPIKKEVYKNGVAVYTENFNYSERANYCRIQKTYSIELLTNKNSIEKTITEYYDSLTVLKLKEITHIYKSIGTKNRMSDDSIKTVVYDGNNKLLKKEEIYFEKYPYRSEKLLTTEYDIGGVIIYQKQGTEYTKDIQTEEFFIPEYVKIEYTRTRLVGGNILIHKTYYNKIGKIIKQETINGSIDYNDLKYRKIQ